LCSTLRSPPPDGENPVADATLALIRNDEGGIPARPTTWR
jgi:hypothetical protein